jgi:hypothetical protein
MRSERDTFFKFPLLAGLIAFFLILGCTGSPVNCEQYVPADLSEVSAFASDEALPFRMPLDGWGDKETAWTNFCAGGQRSGSPRQYHAAEDYKRPAGEPVYAMADGEISFSGRMGGYGWLIIIDHPQFNLYSLYGHLSPSRWRKEPGPVKKGELIAYLGDSHENGGSYKQPLEPHLHFGIRAGQRAEYPGDGEWRWQAGWISPCPADLGWLQPSAVITGQSFPFGGFAKPSGFLRIWWVEILFASLYIIGGTCMLIVAIKKDNPLVLIISCGFVVVAGWIFYTKGYQMAYVILTMAGLMAGIGIYHFMGRSVRNLPFQPKQ